MISFFRYYDKNLWGSDPRERCYRRLRYRPPVGEVQSSAENLVSTKKLRPETPDIPVERVFPTVCFPAPGTWKHLTVVQACLDPKTIFSSPLLIPDPQAVNPHE